MGFTVVVAKAEINDNARLKSLVSDISVLNPDELSEALLIRPIPGKLIDVLKILAEENIQYQLISEDNSLNRR